MLIDIFFDNKVKKQLHFTRKFTQQTKVHRFISLFIYYYFFYYQRLMSRWAVCEPRPFQSHGSDHLSTFQGLQALEYNYRAWTQTASAMK